jgi:hypothetical protein
MSAVGPNGTDRGEFASKWDGIRSQWDDVVPRDLTATFVGTLSRPLHAIGIH